MYGRKTARLIFGTTEKRAHGVSREWRLQPSYAEATEGALSPLREHRVVGQLGASWNQNALLETLHEWNEYLEKNAPDFGGPKP